MRASLGPISVVFMQFSARMLQNNIFLSQTQGLVAPAVGETLDPPLVHGSACELLYIYVLFCT